MERCACVILRSGWTSILSQMKATSNSWKSEKLSFSPLHPYTHRTQRLVWVPWCDSRNRRTFGRHFLSSASARCAVAHVRLRWRRRRRLVAVGENFLFSSLAWQLGRRKGLFVSFSQIYGVIIQRIVLIIVAASVLKEKAGRTHQFFSACYAMHRSSQTCFREHCQISAPVCTMLNARLVV